MYQRCDQLPGKQYELLQGIQDFFCTGDQDIFIVACTSVISDKPMHIISISRSFYMKWETPVSLFYNYTQPTQGLNNLHEKRGLLVYGDSQGPDEQSDLDLHYPFIGSLASIIYTNGQGPPDQTTLMSLRKHAYTNI